MSQVIPESHRDLLDGPVSVAFSTVMPDGQPQSTVIWCDYDGTHLRVNTMKQFQKARNMRANPRVTLFAYERLNPHRYIEVRGLVAEMTVVGAMNHLDKLAELYTGRSPYFGEVISAEWREQETPVLCKIMPTKVRTDLG